MYLESIDFSLPHHTPGPFLLFLMHVHQRSHPALLCMSLFISKTDLHSARSNSDMKIWNAKVRPSAIHDSPPLFFYRRVNACQRVPATASAQRLWVCPPAMPQTVESFFGM